MLQNLKFKKTIPPTKLEKEIDHLLGTLKDHEPHTEEYNAVSDQIVKLQKLQLEINSKRHVSPDTLAGAATNLAGILLILNFEHAHVMTSKAIGFVWKAVK